MAKKSANATLDLFPSYSEVAVNNSSTFGTNMALPIHGWYRYTAGFSAEWVRQLLVEQRAKGRTHVLDPFAGSGTVLLESEFQGVAAMGLESQPYVYKIASAKLLWQTDPLLFTEAAGRLLAAAQGKTIETTEYPELLTKCFPLPILHKLDALKQAWLELEAADNQKDLLWFVITAILRTCSPVGTAQWQYIQPTKTKSKVIDPFVAFEKKCAGMVQDMAQMQRLDADVVPAHIYNDDSRNITSVPDGWADLVITSPPYANNYDYADATRLEMMFWGFIAGWGDLQGEVRSKLIRACTQHVGRLASEVESILNAPRLACIKKELLEVYQKLDAERHLHGGKKNYHFMIAAYFRDLADVIYSLRRVTRPGALMCFVVGDSAPYGIYVPVDRWLGEIALAAGFKNFHFEKLRDRNTKWKNRKHTVPLHEGNLWIEG
jgi:DNA modification methylase